jgi:hypothetical protein
LEAYQAVSFFLEVYNPIPQQVLDTIVVSDSLENAKTQEKLVINLGGDHNFIKISRYPMAASLEWIEEMEKHIEDMEEAWYNGDQKRKIELNFEI